MLVLLLVFTTVVAAGIAAIALAQPRPGEIVVWNDDAERRMLRDPRFGGGWR
jgi:hypothetical protein